MFTDFTDNYLADEIHYNAEGARLIANRYYESLIPFLEN
jgi:lysophospholipase L1-like esterase